MSRANAKDKVFIHFPTVRSTKASGFKTNSTALAHSGL